MSTVVYMVKASITPEHEAAFNEWYNTELCAELLHFPGVVSARRYKALMGEERHQYIVMYEFENEAAFENFRTSEKRRTLIERTEATFGAASERVRSAYVQIWP